MSPDVIEAHSRADLEEMEVGNEVNDTGVRGTTVYHILNNEQERISRSSDPLICNYPWPVKKKKGLFQE